LESGPQDYGEQETGWALSAIETGHSEIAAALHLRCCPEDGSANSVGHYMLGLGADGDRQRDSNCRRTNGRFTRADRLELLG
jgi:hypothetical protein